MMVTTGRLEECDWDLREGGGDKKKYGSDIASYTTDV